MSKIVVLEWDTNVTETHRAEVAFDRLPKELQEAIGKRTGIAVPGTYTLDVYEYLPLVEDNSNLVGSYVEDRQLFAWSMRNE